jgi:uncharacterized protein YciI
METYAVLRRAGPGFDPARPVEEQIAWGPHAEFMLGLLRDGFLLMAGPLGAREGALLIVRAGTEAEIEPRLARDPWTEQGLLETEWIRRWDVRIGAPGA